MAIQLSVTARNDRLDAFEITVGTTPHLKFWSGALPATTATADAGTNLADFTLPSDWMAAASSGSKAKSGTWSVAAAASGTVVHFRIYSSGGTCHMQGTVGNGSGGDMTLDNAVVATGQTITVTTFSLTDANA